MNHKIARVFTLSLTVVFAASVAPVYGQLLAGEREAAVKAIPGIVADGAKWEIVWAGFETADGIVGTSDGGVIFAQEQTDTIQKINPDGKRYIYITDTHGTGAVSMDAQGRVFAVMRTCTDPGKPFAASCPELTMVSQLAPDRRVLANSFPNGAPFGRLNDVIGDGNGGAFFTVGGAYHVNAAGKVTTVENQNLRSNGIMLSRDNRTLYVTNDTVVIAFDVRPDGTTANRRDFGSLAGDNGGDGMAIDAQGRLYVTGNQGVHVFTEQGQRLGMIPTPRRPITLAFSGTDKKTLYVPMMGAVGPDGKAWATPEGVRNTAMTVYKIQMLAEGFKGRPK